MLTLLIFKERLRAFYAKYDMFLMPAIRFALVLTAVLTINSNIGYSAGLKQPVISAGVALLCAALPYGAVSWILSAYILAHVGSISMEMALIIGIILAVIAILYYGFHPGDSYILILTPLLFVFKIPYLLPLLIGLGGSLISVIPLCCGILLYYLLAYVKLNAGALTNDAAVDITQKYVQMINGVLSNKTMLLMIISFTLTLIIVYIIHNMSFDHAWNIAVAAGVISLLLVIFAGELIYDISLPFIELLAGIVFSALLAYAYSFIFFTVDYSRTEYTRFEDDDYYYYVKAVPKIAVTAPDVKVQKITARKPEKKSRRRADETD